MIYKHCKRCRGTGFDPDIDMPGTCEHTSKAPLRSPYKPSMIAPHDRRIFSFRELVFVGMDLLWFTARGLAVLRSLKILLDRLQIKG
jgi:hypothetical protein